MKDRLRYKIGFPLRMALFATALFVLSTTTACSRKSGCPAEDVGMKTDRQGNIKLGKTKSGLLPPKGKKKRKS